MDALIEICNLESPYCCEECGVKLANWHMQHFPRRTLVEGACDTEGCSLRHSHQCAVKVWSHPERRKVLVEIGKTHGIPMGEFFYDASDRAKEAAQS